jgi:hypothetical protein
MKLLGGLVVGGVIGGVAGFLTFCCYMDGVILGGQRIPNELHILVPAILGAIVGAVVVGGRSRLPTAEGSGE